MSCYNIRMVKRFKTQDNYLTISKASTEAGVSTRTLFRWIESGKLKAQKDELSSIWLIRREDLKKAKEATPDRKFEQVFSAVRLFRSSKNGYLFIYAKKHNDKLGEKAFCVVQDDVDKILSQPTFKKLDKEIEKLIASYLKGGEE